MTLCSDCNKEILVSEPSYHWWKDGKRIDLCLVCGNKEKWEELFNEERRLGTD